MSVHYFTVRFYMTYTKLVKTDAAIDMQKKQLSDRLQYVTNQMAPWAICDNLILQIMLVLQPFLDLIQSTFEIVPVCFITARLHCLAVNCVFGYEQRFNLAIIKCSSLNQVRTLTIGSNQCRHNMK